MDASSIVGRAVPVPRPAATAADLAAARVVDKTSNGLGEAIRLQSRTLGQAARNILAGAAGVTGNLLELAPGREAKRSAGFFHRVERRLRRHFFLFPPGDAAPRSGRRVLIVTQLLDRSGSPRIVFEIASIAIKAGHSVTVVAPADGPLRDDLNAIGAAVIVAPWILAWQARDIVGFADGFDIAFCNTILTWKAAEILRSKVPTILYVHEISILEEMVKREAALPAVLNRLQIWCGSELSASVLRPFQAHVLAVPYGIEAISGSRSRSDDHALVIGLFGTVDPRKGQDLAAAAMRRLPLATRKLVKVRIYGQVYDHDFASELWANLPDEMSFLGQLEPAEYRNAVASCDAVLVSSRDDTLPLVSLDALACGRVLMCTPTTGTASYIVNGVSGFVSARADAEAIAEMLASAIAQRERWPAIGEEGRKVFESSFSKGRFEEKILDVIQGAGTISRA